jgi:CHAD domain-containing protein
MSTPDDSPRRFAADAILPRLDRLWKEAKGVRAARDIEPVHKMRVASRRLRTALRLTASALPAKEVSEWIKRVRRITRALGAARDADVQIDFLEKFIASHPEPELQPGFSRLLIRLRQQRHEFRDEVLSSLDQFEHSGVLEEMRHLLRSYAAEDGDAEDISATLLGHAAVEIALRLRDLFSYEPFLSQPDHKHEHHRMRIAAKHLRYALETFAPLYADKMKSPINAVKRVQELLGEVHDCDVWIEQLPDFLEKERVRAEQFFGPDHATGQLTAGVDCLREDRLRERVERFEEFCRYWEKLKKQGLWEKLEQSIQTSSPAQTTNRTEDIL